MMLMIFQTVLNGITHHRKEPVYATCGEKVDIWESNRSEPLRSLTWGVDTVKSIKFNPIEVFPAFIFVHFLIAVAYVKN